MQKLDSLTINKGAQQRTIELWHGDLTTLEQPVDFLVVSAFRNSYAPYKNTLMEALLNRGVSVANLAQDKLIDLRATSSCWLSRPISPEARVPFRQILCFEPKEYALNPEGFGGPTDVVGDIFRTLVPFICGPEPSQVVAMPLVSTGDMQIPVVDMMEAIFKAATQWMEHGLPLRRLMIVERSEHKAYEAKGIFTLLKNKYLRDSHLANLKPNYDIFISYSHVNMAEADYVVTELRRLRPELRIFVDRSELKPGDFWQEKLFRSVDDARRVVCLFSPTYVTSKNCLDEFNLALVLHRQTGQKVLFPIFLHSADLHQYMGNVQYTDCREFDQEKLRQALVQLVGELN